MIEPIDKMKRRQKTTKDRTGRQTEMTTGRQDDEKNEKNKNKDKDKDKDKDKRTTGTLQKGLN